MAVPTLDIEGDKFNCRVDGPLNAPVLVLSNSLGTSLSMWDAQIPALTARFRVLRYDTRGHGASTVTPGPYTIGELGRDVLMLLDALKIRRAHFCGLSMGGMIGMWLGVHAPDRIGRIVLANTAPKIGTPEMWNQRIDNVRKGGMEANVERQPSGFAARATSSSMRRTFPASKLPTASRRKSSVFSGETSDDATGESSSRVEAGSCAANGGMDAAMPAVVAVDRHHRSGA